MPGGSTASEGHRMACTRPGLQGKGPIAGHGARALSDMQAHKRHSAPDDAVHLEDEGDESRLHVACQEDHAGGLADQLGGRSGSHRSLAVRVCCTAHSMRAEQSVTRGTHEHVRRRLPLSETSMMSRALRACRKLASGRAGQAASACGLSRALVAVGATTTGAVAIAASTASCAGARAGSSMPPFHLAIPVHDLEEAKAFYGEVLGLSEGRSSSKWQDYSMFGHQLVVHYVGEAYRVRHRRSA